jgi:hypothetical protein
LLNNVNLHTNCTDKETIGKEEEEKKNEMDVS